MSLFIRNARQVVRVAGGKVKRGEEMRDLAILENCCIGIRDGVIVKVGAEEEFGEEERKEYGQVLDAEEYCVVPGLVDAHTHPVFSGDRVHEFAMKIEGATYMQIHEAGGGIGYTVNCVRSSSEQELLDLTLQRLDTMLKNGTTLIEAKSGYGQNIENELKMLKVLKQANQRHLIDIISTYLPAHALVDGLTEDQRTDIIVNEEIPEIARQTAAGEIEPTMIDVFCETRIFEVQNTKRILEAGKAVGLQPNFHGDELSSLHSGVLAAETDAVAISHAEFLTETDISQLANSNAVVVVLPTTHYILHLKNPPVRELINAGVPVALGSDFNPNAYCQSMPLTMHLACVNLRLSLPEALTAATLNAAASMQMSDKYGSIEPGKYADLLLIKAPRWEHLIYQLGNPPISKVIKKGVIVFES